MSEKYIGVGASKKNGSWYGAINVYRGNTFLWRQVSEIARPTQHDANLDALEMKKELLELNNIKVVNQ